MLTGTLPTGQNYKVARAVSSSALSAAFRLIERFGDCAFSRRLEQGSSVYIVSVQEGEVFVAVGTCTIGRSNNFSSEIYHVCVHSDYRELGLASLLLQYTISNAAKPILFANIRRDNIPSQALFSKLGFSTSFLYAKQDRNGENSMFSVYSKVRSCPE